MHHGPQLNLKPDKFSYESCTNYNVAKPHIKMEL